MNLSMQAEAVLDIIKQKLSNLDIGVKIPDADEYRVEIFFNSETDTQVSMAIGLSDGIFEVSLHERKSEEADNLLYATIVLDEPENSATLTITSDVEDEANYEVIFLPNVGTEHPQNCHAQINYLFKVIEKLTVASSLANR